MSKQLLIAILFHCNFHVAFLQNDECGILKVTGPMARITGGSNATAHEFPWMVYLKVDFPTHSVPLQCTAAIISPNWLLTAAHCTREGNVTAIIRAYLGIHQLSTDVTLDNEVRISYSAVHPQYDADQGFIYDAALLKLPKPIVNFTDEISPICLPDVDELCDLNSPRSFSTVDSCQYTIAAGWGVTGTDSPFSDHLKKVTLGILSYDSCERNLTSTYHDQKIEVPNSKICAIGAGESDTCQGDSGAPLMCVKENRLHVIGIVSTGPDPCGQLHAPALYTRTCSILEWIRQTVKAPIRSLSQCDVPEIENARVRRIISFGDYEEMGDVSGAKVPENSVVDITCRAGYSFSGGETTKLIQCRNGGKWMPDQMPECFEVTTTTKRTTSRTTPSPALPIRTKTRTTTPTTTTTTTSAAMITRSSQDFLAACNLGDVNQVRSILRSGVSVNTKNRVTGETCLTIAARNGQNELAEMLVADFKAYIDAKTNKGETPLILAVQNNNAEMVDSLAQRGADVAVKKPNGLTALHIAAMYGYTNLARYLCRSGTGNFLEIVNNMGETALLLAARNDHADIVYLLLNKGANANAGNNDGWTALHAACESGSLGSVRYICEKGNANLEVASYNGGWTPLILSVWNDRSAVVEYLVSKGGMLEGKSDDGATALIWAVRRRNYEVVDFLVSKGANCNAADNDGTTPLHLAAQGGLMTIVKILCEQGRANAEAKDGSGFTPLMMASSNQTLAVDYLLGRGANATARGNDGGTALHIAAQSDSLDIARLLCEKGRVNTEVIDRLGRAAIIVAVERNSTRVYQYLYQRKTAEMKTVFAVTGFSPHLTFNLTFLTITFSLQCLFSLTSYTK